MLKQKKNKFQINFRVVAVKAIFIFSQRSFAFRQCTLDLCNALESSENQLYFKGAQGHQIRKSYANMYKM